MAARESVDLRDPCRQQRTRSTQISSRVMMKSRCDLDQPLQKRLLFRRRLEPNLLPDLVRLEELTRIKMVDPALELSGLVHHKITNYM